MLGYLCSTLFALFFCCAKSYVYSDEDATIYWISQLNLKPESARYYEGEGLFVGSLTNGTIYKLINDTSNNDDNYLTMEIYFEHENLTSSLGFDIDFDNNIMYICHGSISMLFAGFAADGENVPESDTNLFQSGLMKVDISDPDNKQVIFDCDMRNYNVDNNNPKYHSLNDVVVDKNTQNVYATDFLAGIVYNISYDNEISILSYRDEWLTNATAVTGGLDGIAIDPINYQFLIVNLNRESTFFKIDLTNNDPTTNSQSCNVTNIQWYVIIMFENILDNTILESENTTLTDSPGVVMFVSVIVFSSIFCC